ncbi:MAG: hypothetical protein KBT10_06700 [Bacteroidales bacterium]|nr:hypothetical protein [Candidatus Sodaliphilus aphodohippi]
MASELHSTLERIISKSNVLVEKYRMLSNEKAEADKKLAEQQAEIERLTKEIQRLKRDNEYLLMAHSVAPSPEQQSKARSLISKMVRDIDKCIAQLNA